MPPESDRRRALVALFAQVVGRAGYAEIATPIFEDVGVFLRLGESSDVVTKEMYDFHDKSEPPQHLALRPELTAAVCRAYAEHRPVVPWKVWCEGPQFRYEKPQAGRYRQFAQLDLEVIGTDDPHADVEVIALAQQFYEALGLTKFRLSINSLGDPESRPSYMTALRDHMESRRDDLSEQSQSTLAKNPLRVLDSKRPEDEAIIADAPVMVDYLSGEAADHFDRMRGGLVDLGIEFEVSPRLVRGLDYYTRTTFEFASDSLDGSQNAIGGGGRYDRLVEDLGGPPTPGIGFALGVDRILLACDAEKVFPATPLAVEVFVVDITDGVAATATCDELRRAGISADRSFGGRSMKAQMKVADRSGARYAAIIGADEAAARTISLRDLRGEDGQDRQREVPRDDLIAEITRTLPTDSDD
jgi:histidyl-tRNA synthetase